MNADELPQDNDPRFTAGLIADVFAVLEQHEYRRPEGRDRARAIGASLAALLRLAETFEGKRT